MTVELKGTLKVIFAEEKINDNLSKKEIVITIDEDSQYPQDIICQALNKKIDLLDNLKMGQRVIAKCNLQGKENKGKYYNRFTVYDIQVTN